VNAFILNLLNNKLLNYGFHQRSRNDKCCYCPCSKTIMKEWREKCGIDFKLGKGETCSDKPFTHEGMMQHLDTKARKGNILHKVCHGSCSGHGECLFVFIVCIYLVDCHAWYCKRCKPFGCQCQCGKCEIPFKCPFCSLH
jgi:hypothetical protein